MSWAISAMSCVKMYTQTALIFELSATNPALESGVISVMDSSQMLTQVVLLCKPLAANLALVSVVRMLRSWRCSSVALSMRRVVVSADR